MCVNLLVLGKECEKSHCFSGKFTQLAQILHDHRSWGSRQISTLHISTLLEMQCACHVVATYAFPLQQPYFSIFHIASLPCRDFINWCINVLFYGENLFCVRVWKCLLMWRIYVCLSDMSPANKGWINNLINVGGFANHYFLNWCKMPCIWFF